MKRLWGAVLLVVLGAALAPAFAASNVDSFDLRVLSGTGPEVTRDAVTSGSLDRQFQPFSLKETRRRGGTFWLKMQPLLDASADSIPALVIHKGRHLDIRVFDQRDGRVVPLHRVTEIAQFRAAHDAVFALPDGVNSSRPLYARVEVHGRGSEELSIAIAPMHETIAVGAEHARMIALTFGALMSMALASMLFWFVLSDRLFILYALLISLQAVYIVYFSGQGFDWPYLKWALPLGSYAWNVPAALSGAVSCLFIREIAELRRFSPRVYRVFGWLAGLFVLLAFSNLAQMVGLGGIVTAVGNLVFLGSAAFTLIVAFIAWKRGNRASGFFLLAWGVLEAVTIATALRLLFSGDDESASLLYYGLPASMLAASILIALSVADRLLGQRLALTEAERRAQTDQLTGVLNRGALVERLELACARAKTRGLPLALLFIDLDHFKDINDSFGHPAGDACLAAIIPPIQSELRQSDVVGRYGGEEFVVLLSSASSTAAHAIAERIRERVAEVRVEGFGPPIQITCSIGVAATDTLDVWGEHLIARADAAVYAAKRAGRNKVRLAVPRAA